MQNTMVRGEGGIYSLGKKLELGKMGGKFAGGLQTPPSVGRPAANLFVGEKNESQRNKRVKLPMS